MKLTDKNLAGFIGAILLIAMTGTSMAQKKDYIPWSEDVKLEWKDFKMKPPKLSNLKAMTNSGISFEAKCVNEQLLLKIGCFFDRNESWVKSKEDEDPELLKHEQLHFDITELYTRKLIQQLTSLTDPCGVDMDRMQNIYDDLLNDYNAFQDRYDRETEHSINKEKQKEWEELVATELERLKMYSSVLYSREGF